jgi:hypothetical protein
VNAKNFFAELKRRNVYKVAVAYGVVAWLLIQIATQVFPFLEIPNWAIRLVIMLIIIVLFTLHENATEIAQPYSQRFHHVAAADCAVVCPMTA